MRKIYLPAVEMAALLQLSDRHLRRLSADGILPAADRGYDVVATLVAYLRHAKRDSEGRQARTELAKVESARKRLQLRRQLGHFFTPDEFIAASDRQFELQWHGWMRGGVHLHRELMLVLPSSEALRVAHTVDAGVKAWLIEARDAWRKRWLELRDAARDRERVDGLLRELTAPADDDD